MRAQLASVAQALDVAEQAGKDKDVQIANLGQRLNAALAQKVEELQRYRSDFFGKLREVLANRPGIQVVGDRFVFQSEVLFPVGSADLTRAGRDQIKRAGRPRSSRSATEIPPTCNWILRVDGHADKQPVQGGRFASNWELSSARAITRGEAADRRRRPADHLAATGVRRHPADRPGRHAGSIREEPAHRVAADGSVGRTPAAWLSGRYTVNSRPTPGTVSFTPASRRQCQAIA